LNEDVTRAQSLWHSLLIQLFICTYIWSLIIHIKLDMISYDLQ
jgi:hypothetical protein